MKINNSKKGRTNHTFNRSGVNKNKDTEKLANANINRKDQKLKNFRFVSLEEVIPK
tara:strand:- start:51716 stop:51883 length:168 start_codon:yes stop_codon:yes gene_type:complete